MTRETASPRKLRAPIKPRRAGISSESRSAKTKGLPNSSYPLYPPIRAVQRVFFLLGPVGDNAVIARRAVAAIKHVSGSIEALGASLGLLRFESFERERAG